MELGNWLAKNYSNQFVTVASEKLLIYALGRGVEYRDMPLVRQIAHDVIADKGRFSSMVLGIVKSRPFQMNTVTEQSAPAASTARANTEVRESTEPCRSSRRGTFRGEHSSRAPASRLPFHSLIRCSRPALRSRRRSPGSRRAASSASSSARMGPGHWEPQAEGALPDKLPYILESLEKVKDQTVVLNGLWSQSAEPPEGTTGSDHWVAAAFLTAIKPRKTPA